jgi:hypothetical protein
MDGVVELTNGQSSHRDHLPDSNASVIDRDVTGWKTRRRPVRGIPEARCERGGADE